MKYDIKFKVLSITEYWNEEELQAGETNRTDDTTEEYSFEDIPDLKPIDWAYNAYPCSDGITFEQDDYLDFRSGDTEVYRTFMRPYHDGKVPQDLEPLAQARYWKWRHDWTRWLQSYGDFKRRDGSLRLDDWLGAAPKRTFFVNPNQLEMSL